MARLDPFEVTRLVATGVPSPDFFVERLADRAWPSKCIAPMPMRTMHPFTVLSLALTCGGLVAAYQTEWIGNAQDDSDPQSGLARGDGDGSGDGDGRGGGGGHGRGGGGGAHDAGAERGDGSAQSSIASR